MLFIFSCWLSCLSMIIFENQGDKISSFMMSEVLKVYKGQSVKKMIHVQSFQKSNRVEVIEILKIHSGKVVLKS